MSGALRGRRWSGAVPVTTLLLLLLVTNASVDATTCPHQCVCKWKGGKQTVECVNKALNTIPQGMDPGTQVLDVTGNSLVILSHEKFKVMHLTNLQRIYVSRCKLVQLDDAAFRGLTNLIELDLSDNELTMIPAAALEHVPQLMRLQLSNNPVTKIKDGSFRSLKYLTTLELSSCRIQTLEPRAFQGLDALEWLKMDDNQLSSVPDKIMMPKSLHGVDIHNNPWNCDCKLRQLRTWLVKYNVPSSIEPKCSKPPRLEAKIIKEVEPFDFACIPQVRPSSLFLDVLEGKNVSFECHVMSDPKANIYWNFNGQSLENNSFIYDDFTSFYIYEEEGMDEELTSYLRIEWVSTTHAGVFQCIAENQAGKVISNFTLRISQPIVPPKPEVEVISYLVYIGVALVALVLLVFILLCVLICHCCKRRSTTQEKISASSSSSGNGRSKEGSPPQTNNMPKYIQMGTPAPKVNGISNTPPISVIETSPYRSEQSINQNTNPANPDIISDAADDRGKPTQKRVKMIGVEEVDESGTVTTRKLDDIIEEFEDNYDPGYDHIRSNNQQDNGRTKRGPPTRQASWDTTLPHRRDHEGRQCLTRQASLDIPHKRGQELCNPYPLTEIPPPDEMPPGTRFYDQDGFPVDYGLPKQCSGNGIGHQQPPEYATIRRNKHNVSGTTDLMHDQKYPEEYRMQCQNASFHPPDERYPQSYGLMPDNFEKNNGTTCEFCPQPVKQEFPLDSEGRISGDGCSFDNLLSSCRGGNHCCYENANPAHIYDNTLPKNYRPIEVVEPPPPEGWGDNDEDISMNNMGNWCTHPESPSTRVLYSPPEEQQQPQGTQV
ncbi:unnamed protein product [Meganyctiphanes norvegica]|uniref:Ig-like domain-containing protein n=1 Tax=Meganyctiphanes norvegica TaxID=48144 RepID=A0AAV2QV41_MEGNR